MTKRVFDFIVSLVGLLLLLPFLVIISLSIILDSSGGALFTQRRVGKGRVPFQIYKFRTMHKNAQQHSRLTIGARDFRITRVGYWLRRYKLDELPQLYNVLKGDMSLVGPRPEVDEFVACYDTRQLKVLSIRPGITDPASIEFANESEYLSQFENPEAAYKNDVLPRKLELNLQYLHNRSCWGDLLILLKTLTYRFH
jgi:lipopolysaccharide/colanic/teichoic acid biosynthesis glycosyltransferase